MEIKRRTSTIIAQLLVFNCVLFPLSLLNFTLLHFNESTILITRGISFVVLLLFFLIFYIRKIKLPKYFLFLLLASSFQLLIFQTFHKYLTDFLLLLNFSFIFYNLNDIAKNYFLKTVSYCYFFIVLSLVILQFIGVNIYNTYDYDGMSGQLIFSFGFKNANNFSYFIFVTALLFYRTDHNVLFWISTFIIFLTYYYTATLSTLIGISLFLIYNLLINYYKGDIRKLLVFSIFGFIFTIFIGFYYINILLEKSFGTLVPRVNDIIEFKQIVSSSFSHFLFGGITPNYDCLYTNYILGVGFISFIILIIASIVSARRMLVIKDYFGYFIIMIILTLGLIENILLSASPLSIMFISTLFRNDKFKYQNNK